MKLRGKGLLVSLLGGVFSSLVFAQNSSVASAANLFEVSLSTEYGYLDNFLYQPEQEQSTGFWRIAPSAKMKAASGAQLYSLALSSELYRHAEFSHDDRTNAALEAGYQYKFAHNKRFFIQGTYDQVGEERGTGLSIGDAESIDRPDEWQQSGASLGYQFGHEESVAQLTVEGGFDTKRYNTRRATTRNLDQQSIYAGLSFDYLLSGKSYIGTEAKVSQSDFKYNNTLNETKWEALVGYRWQSTDITRVSALIGYQHISFDQALLQDDSSLKWKIDGHWQPSDYFSVSLSSSRDYVAANRLADSFRVVDRYQLSSMYAFSSHMKLNVLLGIDDEQLIFANRTDKEDYLVGEVALHYNRNDWLSFYGKFNFRSLDNSEPTLNYQRNSFSIGFSVSI
ncbi:outer membrane beta-barrel protein [Thalassotalea fusca]